MDRKNISNKHSVGKIGEEAVAQFYETTQFSIVAQNWRWSNRGEIDIIVYNKQKNILAICEVKTRKINSVIRACEAVNAAKQNKLRILANAFLQKNRDYLNANVRFDVAEVEFDCEKTKVIQINLIENAF